MKILTSYLLLLLLASMSGCKTRRTAFIKTTKEYKVTLTSLASPRIHFVLENKDTIIFCRQDIVNLIDERLTKEIKQGGYLSSKHLADLRESLRSLNADTIIYKTFLLVA